MTSPSRPRTTATPAKRFKTGYRPRVSAPVDQHDEVLLTYEARSEQRNATTSPSSRLCRAGPSGEPARFSSAVGPSGYTSRMRSVSMRPGVTQLTVIPLGRARERLRPAHTMPAEPGVPEREIVDRLADGRRGHVDDAARGAPLEVRKAETRQAHHRDEQQLHRGVERRRRPSARRLLLWWSAS